jgi:predicted aspartyl protease
LAGKGKDMQSFLSKNGYDSIPMQQNAVGLLLVTAKVNGVEGLFILDTGAGASVIDPNHASHLLLVLQNERTGFTGAGAGGRGLEVTPSMGNKIEIGKHVIGDFTLAVMSLEHANQALAEAGAHEAVLGIIGVDILKPGKAIIDYGTMTLYLLSDEIK